MPNGLNVIQLATKDAALAQLEMGNYVAYPPTQAVVTSWQSEAGVVTNGSSWSVDPIVLDGSGRYSAVVRLASADLQRMRTQSPPGLYRVTFTVTHSDGVSVVINSNARYRV